MDATKKRFKRRPKKERIDKPEYFAVRISALKTELETETRSHIIEKKKSKLAYFEERLKGVSNTELYIRQLIKGMA